MFSLFSWISKFRGKKYFTCPRPYSLSDDFRNDGPEPRLLSRGQKMHHPLGFLKKIIIDN
jgi:hypothetical protein